MPSFSLRRFISIFAAVLCIGLLPVGAFAGHVRIIRLSLVQGDVRIVHDSKGDPLANDKALWERAELNLPIRQHDVIATDRGRAEVEFENGAMAFLNENSALEFFDLSLEDGSFTTRLVLRQGTASFYVNPARADYFSVTGGDFTAEVSSRVNFRMDNFDDGSTVAVSNGHIAVVRKDGNRELKKGQSLSMRADDEQSAAVGRTPENDEFDSWVSGREDSVATATTAAMRYSNDFPYTSGFGDLYTYGGFYPVAGYGYGWQPYGVGLGWSPFGFGNWYYGSGLGWSFIGNQPWGWLPYHYGSWIFQPGNGWLWIPSGSKGGGQPVKYHPVTATFVRSGNTVGMVPTHPQDGRGKTLNIAQGVQPLPGKAAAAQSNLAANKWKVVKEPPAEALSSHVSTSTVPSRVSRSVNNSLATVRNSQSSPKSAIVYDAKEHRFVNGAGPAAAEAKSPGAASANEASKSAASQPAKSASGSARASVPASARTAAPSASARVVAPPPAQRTGASRGGFSQGASRGGTTAGSPSTRSSAPASSSRPSGGSASGRTH